MNSYFCFHLFLSWLRLIRNIASLKILEDKFRGHFALNHTFCRGDERWYCSHLAIESRDRKSVMLIFAKQGLLPLMFDVYWTVLHCDN